MIMKQSQEKDILVDKEWFNELPVSNVFLGNIWRLNAVSMFYEQFDKMD